MLQWMSGQARQYRIREKNWVAPIAEKILESRLRLFGHALIRPVEVPVKRVYQMGDSPVVRG